MTDIREAERLRRLAILVAAEREIEAETRVQYATLLAAVAADVLNDEAIVAGIRDPNRGRNQANALWRKLTGSILGKIGNLFARRFRGTGAPRTPLDRARADFEDQVASRLAGVPDEVYADLNRIIDEGVRDGLTEVEIKNALADELLPGHDAYERRLDAVASRVARTSAIAAFNAGDQAGFIAISEHDGVPMATKSWLSSHDTKVRPSHVAADEDPANHDIPADADFTVGGFSAPYPGAAVLPAHEACNCRCTSLYSVDGVPVVSSMHDWPGIQLGRVGMDSTRIQRSDAVKNGILGQIERLALVPGGLALDDLEGQDGLGHLALDDQKRQDFPDEHTRLVAGDVPTTDGVPSFAGRAFGFVDATDARHVAQRVEQSDVRVDHQDPLVVTELARLSLGGHPGEGHGALSIDDSGKVSSSQVSHHGTSVPQSDALSSRGAAVTTPETTLPNGFRGPIAALDVPTGDRRQLCTPEGGVKTREYPLSLTMNHVGDPTGYPVIGHLDRVWAQDGLLYGEGPFDLSHDAGRMAAQQLHDGHLNSVSIDPDMVVAAVNTYDADGALVDSQQLSAEQAEQFRLAGTPFANTDDTTQLLAFTDWRLAGLAMVPIPAYTQARIQPVYDYAPSQPGDMDAIVAAVGGQIFKAEFFGDPKFTEYTPPTIDENGHFYGHVREHGTCYQYGNGAGNGGFCLEPPDSACGYAKFEQHGAKLDDGRTIRVGAITFGDGHYSQGSLKASVAHYNDVATMAAKVNAGTDAFGVWVNGQVLDDYADRAYDLLLSPLSGHWEPDADNRGHLEMIAAHIVITPGYRARRIVAGFDDAGQPNSLIITMFPVQKVPETVTLPPARPRAAVVAAMNELANASKLNDRIKLATEQARKRHADRVMARIRGSVD